MGIGEVNAWWGRGLSVLEVRGDWGEEMEGKRLVSS